MLLIGKNGSGKSTVRHLLELFQRIGRGPNRAGDVVGKADYPWYRTQSPLHAEIELRQQDKSCKYSVTFEWPESFREPRIQNELLEVDGATLFDRTLSEVRLASGVSFGLDWHVLALPVIQERPGEFGVRNVREFFASMMLLSPLPPRMSGFSEAPTDKLLSDGSNLASCLQLLITRKPAAYPVFVDYVQAASHDFDSFEFTQARENSSELMVNIRHNDLPHARTLEFRQLSDGEKCQFLAAYVAASARIVSGVFCFWDEPDNHLSLDEARHFVVALRKLARDGCQFVATSHHPEAIRSFSDETTLVFSRESHFDPVVPRRLSEVGYQGDLIHALIRGEVFGTP